MKFQLPFFKKPTGGQLKEEKLKNGQIASQQKEQAEVTTQSPIKPLISKPEIDNPIESVGKYNLDFIDVIAPQSVEIDFDFIKINNVYLRSLFVSGYPRFVSPGWLEQIINFNSSLDISFFVYPIEGSGVLDDLLHKIAEMEAEISTDLERGKILNPATQAKLEDARYLQEDLVKGSEHFFEFAFYITIRAADLDHLNQITKQVESTLRSRLITAKHTMLDMENGLISSTPSGLDRVSITRNMDTTSLATTFPLTSAELSGDKGILYGLNTQNGSFIIFDRFSMENSNMTVFATSGAGKSLNYESPVLYRDNSRKICLDKIGSIVEKKIKQDRIIKLGDDVEGVENPNLEVFTFDKNLKGKWSKVRMAARKKSPKSLYKIFTKSGREIIITKDHCLVLLKQGEVKATKGNKVRTGDFIPLPRGVLGNKETSCVSFIDSEKLLKENNKIKFLKVKNGRVGNRLFSEITSVPRNFPLTPHFFELLGYFTSEGMIIPNRALISTCSKDVASSVKRYFKSIGLSFSIIKKKQKITGLYVSTQTFIEFLKMIGASGKAHQKRVPSLVFSASNNNISKYLSAYFEGDGGVDGHEISATTKSRGLASDLSYLLLFFGIISRISITKKAAMNSKNKIEHAYYKLRISGQDNISKFINEIGFISNEKNKKASKLLKHSNTNVDVIPDIGPVFEEIYKVLYSSSEIPAPKKFSEIKLGVFKPSPQNLMGIIKEIEKRIEDLENLEGDGLSTLRGLPTTEEIVELGSQKELNKKLWMKLNKSWWTLKNGIEPKLTNALQAISITHNQNYSTVDVAGALYRSFNKTGESLIAFDKSLWNSIINRNKNPLYNRVIKAKDYISEKYELTKIKLIKIKEKLARLKTLVASDLFWDEIVKIKKVKTNHKSVYDLQVDNGVFLAGHGGMFVHNSYFVKLESLRSLMMGTEIIIIDPEGEYKALNDAVGGEYISFSFNSTSKINPFGLTQVYEEGENQLNLKILSLHSLFKIIMGQITPIQVALLDHALVQTYKNKGIDQDPETQTKEPPLMEDLYKVLIGMETTDALDLAARIEKYIRGSFSGIFDQHTNIEINNPFTVFSVKELQDALRPIAMFVVLDYIWTRVKKDLKPRILIVDEAWHMMQYKDSAQFLWSIVKRARKYFLGLTTITQDVEDFLAQDIGRAIVTNSALRVLFKQAPAAIDNIGDTFYLSQGERQLLLSANVGEGIFFAGNNHAPITVVASPEEHKLITTNPRELLEQRQDLQNATPSPETSVAPNLSQEVN